MFFKKNVRIIIKNQNLALEAKTGTNLYTALVSEGVIPPTLCRGNGQCGKCKVHITQKNIGKPNKREQLVLARINLDAGFRLACQTVIKEDMLVDTSEITAQPIADEFIVKPIFKNKAKPEEESTTPAADSAEEKNTGESAFEAKEQTPAPSEHDETQQKTEHAPVNNNQSLDGILLVENRKYLRFFLYSAAIDSVSQEGGTEAVEEFHKHLEAKTLSDFVHDEFKLKDLDRMIIMTEQESDEGEILFDMVSYKTFDIGATPCEHIRPVKAVGDFGLFLRLLSVKNKNRLIVSLDKLDKTYYVGDNKVVLLPNIIGGITTNLLSLGNSGSNPITDISDDMRTIKTQKEFITPDCLPLPMLMKAALLMIKHKIADSDFNIYSRNNMASGVPLEYVVKVVQRENANAFYIYRDKESSLLITQKMMNALLNAKQYIHNAVKYTESYLGNIEAIMICTPTSCPGIVDSMTQLELVPKRHANILVHNSGDSSVLAVKLFQEPNVREYIHKNYGTFIKSE